MENLSVAKPARLLKRKSTPLRGSIHVAVSRVYSKVYLQVQVSSYDPLHPISIRLLTYDPSGRASPLHISILLLKVDACNDYLNIV